MPRHDVLATEEEIRLSSFLQAVRPGTEQTEYKRIVEPDLGSHLLETGLALRAF